VTSQRDIRVWRRVVAFALPLALFAAIGVSGVVLWDQGRLNTYICDGDCGPDFVVPPAEVRAVSTPTLPSARVNPPARIDATTALRQAQRALAGDRVGSRVGIAVADASGSVRSSGPAALIPASTTKVLTGFAALDVMEPQTRFTTRTAISGRTLTLIGGGDPFLTQTRDASNSATRADLATLARRTATKLAHDGVTSVRLRFDDSLFTGPSVNPSWRASYLTDNVVNPTSALALFRGSPARPVDQDPSLAAAKAFANVLEKAGLNVTGRPERATVQPGARSVAAVRSATVEQIVEYVVRHSDNEGAEALLRHIGRASGGAGSVSDGVEGVRTSLKKAGIATSGLALYDGSGLSRSNRIAPRTLVQTLQSAQSDQRTSGLLTDLPMAGFSGSMVERAGDQQARGQVRAKTGTLRGVHSLAGYVTTGDGQPIFFALMTDASEPDDALNVRAALDRATAALAACACSVN
jgi:D-alanyl-D-alanine carboxypeptidase/D-alanyl-D-alanine-endopeptidase (penicillin-binding protein 4)